MKLAHQFREGVKTGRRVLAVMISRLMMREGARAMGEMAAIQKEKKFLKSIGQDVSDSKFSTKGFLVPSRDVTPTASAQVSDDEDAGTSTTASKNKKKKDKKKKKAAEAAAAAAASATVAEDEEAEEEGFLFFSPRHLKASLCMSVCRDSMDEVRVSNEGSQSS